MAAAEYYNSFPIPVAPGQPAPTTNMSQPQGMSQSPYTYNPQSYQSRPPVHQSHSSPPPAYYNTQQDHKPSVHFSPRPQTQQPQQKPIIPPGQYSPASTVYTPPSISYPPPGYQPPPPQVPHQPSQYLTPHFRPHGSRDEYTVDDMYLSDPEHHRRRRKHRDHQRRTSDTSRSTNADGFIGAAGGGLIGDLIFPGLGTVGGALVGWFGGKDYGKHRKDREDQRDRVQEDWERKYGSRSHSRSPHRHSHSHDRKHSYDGRGYN